MCFALAFLGRRDGAVVRALISHQSVPHSILVRCHMWFEFVVGFSLVLRVLREILQFSSLHKNQHFKFKFDQEKRTPRKPALRYGHSLSTIAP